MNSKIEQLLDLLVKITPNRYDQALLIILLFSALAKILDMVITRVIQKWIKKTKI